jgi:hypothetical protein
MIYNCSIFLDGFTHDASKDISYIEQFLIYIYVSIGFDCCNVADRLPNLHLYLSQLAAVLWRIDNVTRYYIIYSNCVIENLIPHLFYPM